MKRSLLFVVLLVLVFSGSANAYFKGPWKGKVIDAETKQPIEGAGVVAVWYVTHPGPGDSPASYLDAEEAVTDKDGNFEISSKFFFTIPNIRYIESGYPQITIFKPGYGSYPRYASSPRGYIKDNYFLDKVGVVELPKITDEKKRYESFVAAGAGEVPISKKTNYQKLLDIEWEYFHQKVSK
ncbi:MAG TPA: hypothetical protein VGK71_07755 [Nitrospirota bacterium]|jgi:hypothetical protein